MLSESIDSATAVLSGTGNRASGWVAAQLPEWQDENLRQIVRFAYDHLHSTEGASMCIRQEATRHAPT